MTRHLPDWMPPATKTRAANMRFQSVRQIERAANLSNNRLHRLLTSEAQAMADMVSLLKALGYSCNSPEFDVINEFCSQNILADCRDIATISTSNKSQNFYVLQTQKIPTSEQQLMSAA